MLQGTTLLHTGSIATMLAPGAAEVLAAVEHAHPSTTISFDPNCRPSIITDVDYARRQAEKFVALADVVKASDEDLEWLYPGVDPLDSARRWLSLGGSEGPAMVVVTRGAERARGASTPPARRTLPPPAVEVAAKSVSPAALSPRAPLRRGSPPPWPALRNRPAPASGGPSPAGPRPGRAIRGPRRRPSQRPRGRTNFSACPRA